MKRVRIDRCNPREETGDPTAPKKLWRVWVDGAIVDSATTKQYAQYFARLARKTIRLSRGRGNTINTN